MSDLLHLTGLTHPLVLHAPIGALVALCFAELWYGLRGRELEARPALAVFCALAGVASALSGWLLAGAGDHTGEVVFRHRWGGVTLAVLLVLLALTARPARSRLYTGLLLLALGAAVLTGHWGATITHGAGYFELDEPAPSGTPPAPPTEGPPVLSGREPLASNGGSSDLAPEPAGSARQQAGPEHAGAASYAAAAAVLSERCLACHGPSKQKGRLALHTPELLAAGGFSGPVVVPGAPAESELLRRLQLPLEHEDHMPPEGKPQPGADEVALIESWIAAGAPLPSGSFPEAPAAGPGSGAGAEERSAPAEEQEQASRTAPGTGSEELAALAELRAERLHVEPLEPDGAALWIDAAARPDLDDERARALLWPLRARVVELSLARTQVGDAAFELAAAMPRLERLDLRATRVGPAGPAALAGHPALRTLNLSDTHAGRAALEVELPALRELLVYGCELGPEALARAAAERPDLAVRSALTTQAPLEIEPAVALGPAGPAGAGPGPTTALCPVSGRPADPSFALEVDGEILLFCCATCPETWRADPGAFTLAVADAVGDSSPGSGEVDGTEATPPEPPAASDAFEAGEVETAPLRR